jgi:Type VI secretion system/phage-baseplate injector OB domain
MNDIHGKWPGVVTSYDPAKRTCRVKVDGITDGAGEELVAQIMQAIGDRSENTEIEILPGDRVWLEFERGDARYPLIVGYRAKNVENALDWRRWHHKNVEIKFDDLLKLLGAGASVTLDSGGGTAAVKVNTAVTIEAGSSVTIKAGGCSITMEGGAVFLRDSAGGKIGVSGGLIHLN